jgi:predicted small lipoprotein YifL
MKVVIKLLLALAMVAAVSGCIIEPDGGPRGPDGGHYYR